MKALLIFCIVAFIASGPMTLLAAQSEPGLEAGLKAASDLAPGHRIDSVPSENCPVESMTLHS